MLHKKYNNGHIKIYLMCKEGTYQMSQYRLDVMGEIGLSDYSNISDYFELVDSDDKFTITFDRVSPENINIVCSMLQEKRFSIYTKEEQKDGKVYLSVGRKA